MGDVSSEDWESVVRLYLEMFDEMAQFATRTMKSERSHLAQDLVHEVFKDAALQWKSICERDRCAQRAWLYRVLKNKIFDLWRHSDRSLAHLDESDSIARLDTSLTAISNLLLENCWRVIEAMPSARRRVAILRWQGDWSIAEIAEHLDIKESTVRVQVMRAQKAIKEELGSEIVFPSEWPEVFEGEEEVG